MSSADDAGLARRRALFWLVAVLTLIADLLTKHFAFAAEAAKTSRGLVIIPDILRFIQHINKGALFGLMSNHPLVLFLVVAVIVPGLVLLTYSCRAPGAPLWSLGLILGGAAGNNLFDRPLFGGVRDFVEVDLHVPPANPWPVFNVADAAIVAGFMVYLIWSLFLVPPASGTADAADAAKASTSDSDAATDGSG